VAADPSVLLWSSTRPSVLSTCLTYWPLTRNRITWGMWRPIYRSFLTWKARFFISSLMSAVRSISSAFKDSWKERTQSIFRSQLSISIRRTSWRPSKLRSKRTQAASKR
jgi:hypothetical protein